jgi:hypothetical protein
MKHGLVGAAVALALSASSATAQMFGNPVYVPVGMGTGVNIAGDFGHGVNVASGKGNYFGGRVTLGLPFFYVTAGAGSYKAQGATTSQTEFGGNLGLNLLHLPLVPVKVSAQAGAGYVKVGTNKLLNFPVALAVGVSLPTPGIGITPWIAPRLQVNYATATGVSSTKAYVGGSGGVNVHFSMIGIHAAVDYLHVGSGVSPLTFGVGASLGLTLPGI